MTEPRWPLARNLNLADIPDKPLARFNLGIIDSAGVTVDDAAPTIPVDPAFWYESDTGSFFVSYDGFWVEVGSGAVVVLDGGGA